jgi:hypothetical protein
MKVYHVTPAYNVESILSRGVDVSYTLTGIRRMWFVPARGRNWAKGHVAKRHKCPMHQLAIICVEVPEDWVRSQGDGKWTCDRTVPPAHITGVHFTAKPAA